jgi:hypothetical protein
MTQMLVSVDNDFKAAILNILNNIKENEVIMDRWRIPAEICLKRIKKNEEDNSRTEKCYF